MLPLIGACMSLPDTTQVGSLDMARHTDRGLLRRTITDAKHRRPRWTAIDESMENDFVKALRVALRIALEKGDHRAVGSCVATLALLVGQQQSDEQHGDKMAAGQIEESNGTVRVIVERRPYIVAEQRPDSQTPALPSGPAEASRQRATVQRGDVGPPVRQDHDGGVPAD